jgi:hypothetical protein
MMHGRSSSSSVMTALLRKRVRPGPSASLAYLARQVCDALSRVDPSSKVTK